MRSYGVMLVVCLALAACGDHREPGAPAVSEEELRALAVPAELQGGKATFEASCAACHGQVALGTEQGPPLLHPYYEPGHHSDEAFHLAVTQGAMAHHWSFGNMPPVPGLGREEVSEVIAYVRWLQRQAGVY